MVGALPPRFQPVGVPAGLSREEPISNEGFGQILPACRTGVEARAKDKSSTTKTPPVTDEPPDTTETRTSTAPIGTITDCSCLVKVEVAMVPPQPGLSPVTTKWFWATTLLPLSKNSTDTRISPSAMLKS